MINIKGRVIISKKDVRTNPDGLWVHFAFRPHGTKDKNEYHASYKTERDDPRMEMLSLGDVVDIKGIWVIKKMKQADGTNVKFNTIELDEIKLVHQEPPPW